MKTEAKAVIKGKVFELFLVLLAYDVLGGIAAALFGDKSGNGNWSAPVLMIAANILLIPMFNGVKLYFYSVTAGNRERFSTVFAPYNNGAFKELIIAKLIVALYIVLGTICLVIPGIYMALKYSMVDYIFVERPKATHKEAMLESAEIMKGHVWDLFVLLLSFIGWAILGVLTLGILFIYIAPYVEATQVQFYLKVRKISVSPDITITPSPESEIMFR